MNYLLTGAIGGFLAVGFSAFGAHALKAVLSDYARAIFETAADYQFYHSLALILVAILIRQSASQKLIWSARFIFAGTLLFSGSLYALSLSGIRWLGAITPVGGIFLLLGWLMLALYAYKPDQKLQ